MTPFHVGMRVVCVEDNWRHKDAAKSNVKPKHWIKKSDILQISRIVAPGSVYLYFFGLPDNNGFNATGFRPAHENRMDELRTLLAPVPSKELVQS